MQAEKRMRLATTLGLLLVSVSVCGCASRAATGKDDPVDTHDVAYASVPGVDPSLLSLDIHRPASGSGFPVVIWIHGGGWLTGDKANGMEHKVPLFNGEGWMLVSANYRLSPNPPDGDPGRVMFPDFAQDVAAAVAWVRVHAAEYGGDPDRLALLGHSAGAHLVALVATDADYLAAHSQLLASVLCVGSFDTEAYDIPAALETASTQQQAILENAFGTDPTVHIDASPVTHAAAGSGIPPFLIAVRGGPERRAIQTGFRDALVGAGISATTIDAGGLSHAEVNDAIGAPGDTVMTPPILTFLEGCFD